MPVETTIEEFLLRHHRSYLVVPRATGVPTAYPMTSRYIDGSLWFTTYRRGAKVPQLRAAETVACLVTGPGNDLAGPSVVVRGRCTVHEPSPDLVERWLASAGPDEYAYPGAEERHRRALAAGKRVLLEIPVADAELVPSVLPGAPEGPA